jgi:hypothetical protein
VATVTAARLRDHPSRSHVIMVNVPLIINRECLEERFGTGPSFHDAEIHALRLDAGQRASGRPSLELDVHVFAVDGTLPDGRYDFVGHTMLTLRFEGIEAVELDGFGRQNVLDDLILDDVASGTAWDASISVTLPSNNGLGGAFRCESVIVQSVTPFEPGPFSIYHRPE